MNHYLLLGAGFSRNWGGWLANEVFEYLLGVQEVVDDTQLQADLWRHKDRGGFEAALEELQIEASRSGDRRRLETMENAVQRMFADMDKGFQGQRGELFRFEFVAGADLMRQFLSRFDAIFTLNQDVLLERQYFNEGMPLLNPQKWDTWGIPGMRAEVSSMVRVPGSEEVPTYTPSGDFNTSARIQPFLKLHGSANWRDQDGRLIIALGGNKAGTIRANDVLTKQFSYFRTSVSQGACRLMIIGYGFQDQHINQLLLDAVTSSGLRLFIIDPLGVDVALENRDKPLRQKNKFAGYIIGASRRSLREIFGTDQVERAKVIRFFDP
jgi:hypothetical protein